MNFNIVNMAIADHYAKVESAINYLVDLYEDDIDISDETIFRSVLRRYHLLDDGFESEVDYIKQEVSKRIA